MNLYNETSQLLQETKIHYKVIAEACGVTVVTLYNLRNKSKPNASVSQVQRVYDYLSSPNEAKTKAA